jgi:N utilization substance protein B
VKNKHDPRHINRIKNIQAIFAWECGGQPLDEDTEIKVVTPKIIEIDQIIQENAPKWPLNKINKVDLCILRYALWELIYKKENPSKVVIDEAIEIAKEYGTESSPAFINGVIGSAVKKFELTDLN